MEKQIMLKGGRLQAVNMPEKPRKPNSPHVSENENPDYYLDVKRYERELEKAKAEAIDFRQEDYRINKLKIEFFNPATVYHTLEQIKEGEIYPRPNGFEIEIIDHYEGTVNNVRQYSKYARLVPIKEPKSITKEQAEKLSYPDGGGEWLVDGIWMQVHCDEYHMHSFKCLVPIKEQKKEEPSELRQLIWRIVVDTFNSKSNNCSDIYNKIIKEEKDIIKLLEK